MTHGHTIINTSKEIRYAVEPYGREDDPLCSVSDLAIPMSTTIANDFLANAIGVALLLVAWILCVECRDMHAMRQRIRAQMSK